MFYCTQKRSNTFVSFFMLFARPNMLGANLVKSGAENLGLTATGRQRLSSAFSIKAKGFAQSNNPTDELQAGVALFRQTRGGQTARGESTTWGEQLPF